MPGIVMPPPWLGNGRGEGSAKVAGPRPEPPDIGIGMRLDRDAGAAGCGEVCARAGTENPVAAKAVARAIQSTHGRLGISTLLELASPAQAFQAASLVSADAIDKFPGTPWIGPNGRRTGNPRST
jgi:hypothetical protein